MPRLQERVFEVLASSVDGKLLSRPQWPQWLQRPAQSECGRLWDTVCRIYSSLTDGMILPASMPARESRSVDRLLMDSEGTWRIIEFDESQHFNPFRAETIRAYPQDIQISFPLDIWLQESARRTELPGAGFARPRPPLFPMAGGRHRQRAFRDALTDLLPSLHDFRPTLRIADFEVEAWIWDKKAKSRLRDLVISRSDVALKADRSSRF